MKTKPLEITVLAHVLASLLLVATASARLGETPDQCAMRYGNSTGASGQFTIYSKDHILIAVLFEAGRSVREVFSSEPGAFLNEKQVVDLLNANSESAPWKITRDSPGFRKYERADSGAIALYEWITLAGGERGGKQLTIRAWPSKVPQQEPASGF